MNVFTKLRITDCSQMLKTNILFNLSRSFLCSSQRSAVRSSLHSPQQQCKVACLFRQNLPQKYVNRRNYSPLVEEGTPTHKPSPFQQKILVWEKYYPTVDKVPDRVTKNQMKKAMDKFRVRCSILMIAITLVAAAVMAAIGRFQRDQGLSVSKINKARYN